MMTFAYSRQSLARLLDEKFRGEWKYLRKALFEVSEQRAVKACIELATYLRVLDDEQDLSGYQRKTKAKGDLGRVIKEGQPDEPLFLRDMTNKIVHAAALHWDFTAENSPRLICIGRNPDRWERAEIDIVALAAHCGMLMS
jgi:hypothetical protein